MKRMDIKQIERRIFLSGLNSEMHEKRITQKELGKNLGIRQSQLSLWLSGNTGMSLDNLIRISNAVKNWETRDSQILNEKTLAARVGTSQSRISEYIRGAVVPSLGVAARICKELQIDPKVFIDACCRL